MTSIVTGARGFIGSALIAGLRARGENVVAVTRNRQPEDSGATITWKKIDPLSPCGWSSLFERPVKAVYHLAWSTVPRTANSDPAADLRDNLAPSLALLEAITTSGQNPRLVFASSGGTVYGPSAITPITEHHPLHPISAYGITKVAFENYIELFRRLHGINAVSLRIGNPFGPGQDTRRHFGAVTTFAARALRNEPIHIYGDGSVVRDYLYIDDLVAALMAAGDCSLGGAFNIGSGAGVSLNQIVGFLSAELGRTITVEYKQARAFDVPVSILDISRARIELGWHPRIAFDDGLRRLLDGLRTSSL